MLISIPFALEAAMINAQVDEKNAILVTEIYDEYPIDEYKRIMDIKIGLAERHGFFSEMELLHGEGRNAVAAGVAAGIQKDQDYAELAVRTVQKKVRYAYVASGQRAMKFIEVAGSILMPYKARAFDIHERDEAMAWLIEGNAARRERLARAA